MVDFLTLSNHLAPVAVTMLFCLILVFLIVGVPYLRFTALVADADSEEGIKILAQYLARHTGGRKINVDKLWESFIPAARSLHKEYVSKRFLEVGKNSPFS